MPPKSTNVYVLKLEGGRRYVGKSANIPRRLEQHFSGNGSVWTKKYKPVSVEKVLTNVSDSYENKITKEMMSKHGVDKVRGGSYTAEKLSKGQKYHLEKAIKTPSYSSAKNYYSSTYIEDSDEEYDFEDDEEENTDDNTEDDEDYDDY
jgi:predicted GIY-YIG superfamily endonuclease